MSLEPVQRIRVEPASAARRVRDRDHDRDGEPRRQDDGEARDERRDEEPSDGLPHIDVRA